MVTMDLLGVFEEGEMRRRLGMVFWVEGFFGEGGGRIWREIGVLREGLFEEVWRVIV